MLSPHCDPQKRRRLRCARSAPRYRISGNPERDDKLIAADLTFSTFSAHNQIAGLPLPPPSRPRKTRTPFSRNAAQSGGLSVRDKRIAQYFADAVASLRRLKDDVAVSIERSYNKVQRTESLVEVAQQVVKLRQESERLAQNQLAQGEEKSNESPEHSNAAS
jgi:hypothetical protein